MSGESAMSQTESAPSDLSSQPPNAGASTSPSATRAARQGDIFWGAGLGLAVLGLFVTSVAPGIAGWLFGLGGLSLGVSALLLVFRASRRVSWGALVTVTVSVFTAFVGSRSSEPPTIALKDAPRLRQPETGEELDTGAPSVSARGGELFFHPGPVALGFGGLPVLGEGQLRVAGLVAAPWDGAWFAGDIVALENGNARVHFTGWEADWDTELPVGSLRGLSPGLVPKPLDGELLSLGKLQPEPGDFRVAVFQPTSGLVDGTELGSLQPDITLFNSKLDVTDSPLARALPGLKARDDLPLALLAEGAVYVSEAGARYFSAVGDGDRKLWLDQTLVEPGKPIQLAAGAHRLRLEYRHPPGGKLSLSLRTGTSPQTLRALDLKRDGVAQSLKEPDGGLRLVIAEGVLFDTDKDELKPSSELALSSIYASSIAPVPTTAVLIEGHTDDRGTGEHNLDLSQRRAARVRGWLVAKGRSEAGLGTRALGETRPRVPNDSDAHRRANRRVELVIGGAAAAAAATTPTSPAASTSAPAGGGVVDLLRLYYAELNAGSFDANHYFEPSIERYITMQGTSTSAVNHYIRDIFPTQFKQPHFELEEGSLSAEGPGQYVFVEHSRYVMARKTQVSDRRARVRVRLGPSGKIVFFHQFQRL
jgi:outer membrane protein OmpA-like peptidoglycan-associated protein